MSGHTPGPWQHKHLDFLSIVDSDGEARGCSPIARVAGGNNAETRAEARANARLIVAAPELLQSLRRLSCVAIWDEDTDREEFDAAMRDAESAIAKATR